MNIYYKIQIRFVQIVDLSNIKENRKYELILAMI